MESNDHDLLVRLDTKVELIIAQFNKFNDLFSGLSERVTALETKDSRDSEKVQAINKDVQRSLQNYERINSLEAEQEALKESVKALTSKSNLWDVVNGFGVALAAIIGYLR